MSDTNRYWNQGNIDGEKDKTEEVLSENIEKIKEMYSLLSVEDKVMCKKVIREINIF